MAAASSPVVETRRYRFDGFVVDPARRLLLGPDGLVPVTPKAFSILLILLEKRGEVVEKEELLQRIWPETFVTEANLTQNVSALRKALGERANDHRYVVTVPGQGYSFVADVETPETPEPPELPEPPAGEPPERVEEPGAAARSAGPRFGLAAAALLLGAALLAALFLPQLDRRRQDDLAPAAARREPSPEPAREALALRPAGTESNRLYTQGLERLRAYDTPAAVSLLRQAEAAEPGSAAIHSALAQAWADLGYDARAGQEARQALALSAGLPRLEKLAVQARAYQAGRQWARAGEIYRSLWTFYPDDLEAGLRLAECLSEGDRGQEALAILARLRRLPPPNGQDPRIDLVEARAFRRLSDVAGTLRAARAAAEKGRASGAGLLVAQAGIVEGWALLTSGRAPEAFRRLQQSRALFAKAGDAWGAATALSAAGLALSQQGDLDGAEKAYREALGTAEKTGNVAGIVAQLGNLGLLYQDKGDLVRALSHLEQARARFAEIDDPLLESRVLSASAAILIYRADLDPARERLKEILALSRRIGNRDDEAQAMVNLAATLIWRGDVKEAWQLTRDAFRIQRERQDPAQAALALAAWAEATARLGDLATARQRYEEALALERRAGDRINTAHLLGALAWLEIRAGNLAAARAYSEAQLRIARETGSRILLALSEIGLGREQTVAGELAEARRSLESALADSAATGDQLRVAGARTELARLTLAEGDDRAAARLAGEAALWWREHGILWGESRSLAIQAEALARLGRSGEAATVAGRVHALTDGVEDRDLALTVAAALARADAASSAGTLRDLRQAIAEAHRRGFGLAELEARLALGEILLAGDPAAARGELETTLTEAEARGLHLLARRADAALKAAGIPRTNGPLGGT